MSCLIVQKDWIFAHVKYCDNFICFSAIFNFTRSLFTFKWPEKFIEGESNWLLWNEKFLFKRKNYFPETETLIVPNFRRQQNETKYDVRFSKARHIRFVCYAKQNSCSLMHYLNTENGFEFFFGGVFVGMVRGGDLSRTEFAVKIKQNRIYRVACPP